MTEILNTVGKYAGFGGIVVGTFLILFREFIRKNIFSNLTKEQSYNILKLFLILVWSIAILGILSWVFTNNDVKSLNTVKKDDETIISTKDITNNNKQLNNINWHETKIGLEFIFIPQSSFRKVCNKCNDEDCDVVKEIGDELNMNSIWYGKYQVTEGQWKHVMGVMPKNYYNGYLQNKSKGDYYPVEVTWEEANNFANKLSSLNNWKYKFRLPKDIEREYACRNGGKDLEFDGGCDKENESFEYDYTTIKPMDYGKTNKLGIYCLKCFEWGENLVPIYDGKDEKSLFRIVFSGSCTWWFASSTQSTYPFRLVRIQ